MSNAATWRSPEFKARLAELWGRGLSQSQVGAELGVTKHVVAGLVGRMGLERRPTGKIGAEQMAERIAAVRKLVEQGLHGPVIAARLGISTDRVQEAARAAGVTISRAGAGAHRRPEATTKAAAIRAQHDRGFGWNEEARARVCGGCGARQWRSTGSHAAGGWIGEACRCGQRAEAA